MTTPLQQRHQDYVIGPNQDSRLASVAAGATLTDITLQLDSDAPFLLRSRAVRQAYTIGSTPTQNGLQFLKMRWTGPVKDYRQQQLVSVAAEMAYFGGVGNFKPEFPNVQYPASGFLTCDIQNLGGNPLTNLMLFFRGVKLYPWGTVPAYTYPKRFAGLAFPGYQIPVLALGPTERRDNQTFTVKQDADFVLRAGQATAPFNTGEEAPSQFSEVFIQLMDFNKKPYSNDFMPLDIIFGSGAQPIIPVGATSLFQAPRVSPGLFYPEIYLPANHQLIYNLLRSDGPANSPVDFTINLIGQKVFPQGS